MTFVQDFGVGEPLIQVCIFVLLSDVGQNDGRTTDLGQQKVWTVLKKKSVSVLSRGLVLEGPLRSELFDQGSQTVICDFSVS